MTTSANAMNANRELAIHPAWLRLAHWLNAVAIVIMVTSGWRIYNASPLNALVFPREITLGGWLGGALQWHFAGMWLLTANGLAYLLLNLFSGRLLRKFFPIRFGDIRRDLRDALHARLRHDDAQHYNSLQRTAYLFVIIDAFVLVFSGLVLWKSVQFPLLRELLGGYELARQTHFFAMAALVVFVVGHVLMVLLVPRSLITMIRGR